MRTLLRTTQTPYIPHQTHTTHHTYTAPTHTYCTLHSKRLTLMFKERGRIVVFRIRATNRIQPLAQLLLQAQEKQGPNCCTLFCFSFAVCGFSLLFFVSLACLAFLCCEKRGEDLCTHTFKIFEQRWKKRKQAKFEQEREYERKKSKIIEKMMDEYLEGKYQEHRETVQVGCLYSSSLSFSFSFSSPSPFPPPSPPSSSFFICFFFFLLPPPSPFFSPLLFHSRNETQNEERKKQEAAKKAQERQQRKEKQRKIALLIKLEQLRALRRQKRRKHVGEGEEEEEEGKRSNAVVMLLVFFLLAVLLSILVLPASPSSFPRLFSHFFPH